MLIALRLKVKSSPKAPPYTHAASGGGPRWMQLLLLLSYLLLQLGAIDHFPLVNSRL